MQAHLLGCQRDVRLQGCQLLALKVPRTLLAALLLCSAGILLPFRAALLLTMSAAALRMHGVPAAPAPWRLIASAAWLHSHTHLPAVLTKGQPLTQVLVQI